MSVERPLRVGLDLSGSLEALGNTTDDLARALSASGECSLVRFRTGKGSKEPVDAKLRGRWWWPAFWKRGRGRAIDSMLPPVDIIHVTGVATPPTKHTPLVVTVDDLRPLRGDRYNRQRVKQLRRLIQRGAHIVASSNAASAEVQESLGMRRDQIAVVAPAVPPASETIHGADLVVNLTGATSEFLRAATGLVEFAELESARIVVLASREAASRIRSAGVRVDMATRSAAPTVLANARVVVHLSDGARFPLFAIAALAAGVPTCATATAVNRELLEGAALLVPAQDPSRILSAVRELWSNDQQRAILFAAGVARASDFAPEVAAKEHLSLYREIIHRGRRE